MTLADGQIMVEGPLLDAGDFTIAVTGGTGAYGEVRGELGNGERHERQAGSDKPKAQPAGIPRPVESRRRGLRGDRAEIPGALFSICAGDASLRSGDEGDRRGVRAWHDHASPCACGAPCHLPGFSAAMLAQLRRNMVAIDATNVEVVEGDGQALPFEDSSFDIGVSMFGLMFFPDRAKGFSELHRVLVPGGQVLVSSWAPSDQSSMMRTVFAALQPDDAPPQPVSRLSGLEDRDLFEREMREAGFVDVRIELVTHGEAVEDVDRFWSETVRAMAPITLLKHNSSSEDWAKIEATALDRLRRALPDLPTELTSTAYLAAARRA